MFHKLIKASLLLSMTLASAAWAQNSELTVAPSKTQTNMEVDLQQHATDQELAVLYVIAEMCPTLIEKQEIASFEAGYQKFGQEYLEQSNPLSYILTLSKENKFQPALNEALTDAKNAGDLKNREICRELVAYSQN